MNTAACKRLFSLGCVPHTDGAVFQIQVAATVLGIPTDVVFVAETSTDTVPNSSPTAASASSDLYGMAVLLAAKQLEERLRPVREKLGPEAAFRDIAEAAYFQQIDLCAHGFYKTPDIFMDWDAAKEGVPQLPFNYFCTWTRALFFSAAK